MADPGLLDSVNDDHPSATPLDLLLNAISDSGTGLPLPSFADSHDDADLSFLADHAPVNPKKRSLEDAETVERQSKVARTFLSHIVGAGADAVSTVQVWHPRSAQKSYGKERRMINPPPTVRVTGPLFSVLTSATLSTSTATGGASSSQTHEVPLVLAPELAYKDLPFADQKKGRVRIAAYRAGWGGTLPWERRRVVAKERHALADGLAFPGLWVGDTKDKEFVMELKLGLTDEVRESTDGVEAAAEDAKEDQEQAPVQLDEAALRHVLGEAGVGIDPLNLGDGIAEHFASPAETVRSQAQAPHAPVPGGAPAGSAWATLASPSLTIVSKPSQKTAKARSMDSCLATTDAVALWVRVHGQTVRTKYLYADAGTGLQSRTGKWTPFRFDILARAARQEPPPNEGSGSGSSSRPRYRADDSDVVTYGSVVRLIDAESGARSEPVRLVKVDRNEAALAPATDDGNPISELQRVGFVRVAETAHGWVDDVDDTGARLYLGAPGATAGAAEVKTKRARPRPSASSGSQQVATADADAPSNAEDADVPETLGVHEADSAPLARGKPGKRKAKTKRHALAKATIAEEAEGSTTAALSWVRAARAETDAGTVIEQVNDWMCWVIGAVSSFSYSFFDTVSGLVPTQPLGAVAHLLAPPIFQAESDTLELTLSDFYVASSPDSLAGSPARRAFDVYLGPLGPLRVETYRSTAVRANHGAGAPAEPVDEAAAASAASGRRKVTSNFPRATQHVIAVIDVPPADDILQAMHECALGAGPAATATPALEPAGPAYDGLGVHPQGGASAPPHAGHGRVQDNARARAQAEQAEAEAWLGDVGGMSAHEMTIQDALRHADVDVDVDVGVGAHDLGGVGEHDFLLDPALSGEAGVGGGGAPATAADEHEHAVEHADDLDADLGLFVPEQPLAPDASAGANVDVDVGMLEHMASAADAAALPPSPPVPPLALRMEPVPPPAPARSHMAALPLLLVRPDAVGFDLGYRVVAERLGGAGVRWGLRVVKG
ncbi:hypothetical protein Q5752_005929 [Cryptotrichosporon argae]